VIWVLFSPSQTRSGDPASLPKDSFFQLIESTMKKIESTMVNERGRVLAIHGSGTFSCADKGVEAQLSSTSGARLAKGTLWFGTTRGHLEGWKRSSQPACRQEHVVRHPSSSRSRRWGAAIDTAAALGSASCSTPLKRNLKPDWQFPLSRKGGTQGWYTRNQPVGEKTLFLRRF
jgi:hypothetical protein